MRRLICIGFVVLLIGCKDAEQPLVQNNSVSSEQQIRRTLHALGRELQSA